MFLPYLKNIYPHINVHVVIHDRTLFLQLYHCDYNYLFHGFTQTTGKEYPRLANGFLTDSENTKGKRRKPALRIVDQRNLAEETKLTLYKERSRGRVKGPSTTEQKFRLMIAREKSATSSQKSDVWVPLGITIPLAYTNWKWWS